MPDFLFPRKETLFNIYNDYNSDNMYADISEGAKYYVDLSEDDTSFLMALTKRSGSQCNQVQFNLLQHVPGAAFNEYDELSHSFNWKDVTEYEVYLQYKTQFDGNLNIAVYNCDLTDIEIQELYLLNLDFSASGLIQSVMIATIESNSTYLVNKNPTNTIPMYIHFNKLDESDNIIQQRVVTITDLTEGVQSLVTLESGRYLVLSVVKIDHTPSNLVHGEQRFVSSNYIEQTDVTSLTSKDFLRYYYKDYEEDVARVYYRSITIQNQNTLDYINSINGMMFSFNIASDEMQLYREKDLIFRNYSNIDTTFVVRNISGSQRYEVISNDTTIPITLTGNQEDTIIEVFSDDFTLNGTYDLSCEVRFTPCIVGEQRVGKIVDQILILPDTTTQLSELDFIMTDGLTIKETDIFIGSGLTDTTA